MPELDPDWVLIKTMAVALNPTDWKHIDFIATKGATVGCDYAGIVEGIGSEVDPERGLQVGDRVAGFNHGCNGENLSDGSFAEYIAVKAHINIKLPDWMTFSDGATLAMGITTVAQGMYQQLKLPLPSVSMDPLPNQKPILIYGGSTATGESIIKCCAALSPPRTDCKIKYCGLFTVGALPRSDIEAGFTMAYTALGESQQKWDNYYPGSSEDARFIGDFMKLTSELVKEKKIQTHPAEVGSDGLEGVLKGLNRLRKGDLSGVKLVYTL
ncbi:hypothetical protein EYZ11_001046 [Aspergillus tanneri]|uniref:Alcohol dehydrogenase-like N-terminal domain-containing protein n=1 Tax=Aspergillus tanneri TaxID=1220188 RepID=A0A4S3JVQ8_9EURO|nr:uncharacterized protein ATNIH1004_011411 [Aspergillus tanneri]KAA8642466.1 hypothetical protein ATNIH1004_011411 [Aspergillus tanneri]THC99497.1 hypothetical protein EYZ11_001046 [Aspergillus tanneri]